MKYLFYIALLSGFCFLFSCKEDQREAEERSAVAVAGNEFLQQEDVNDRMLDTGYPADSVGTQKLVIENWAREALFYQEAMTKLKEDEVDIQKQVEEYKRDLVNHIYQTKIIEANLDTLVSKEEIETYYSDNKESFILKDNIVKVNYYKIPMKAQPLEKMKRLIYSAQTKDKEQLLSLLSQHADNFFVNDSTWLYLEDVRKEIPKLKDVEDHYIYAGRVMEFNDEMSWYYLKIKEVKTRNSVSPLNFERQNIKRFIVNRRKSILIRQYKQQLLEKAIEEKRFRIKTQGK